MNDAVNDQALLAAYRTTRWQVQLPGRAVAVCLNESAPPELRPSGIITAYNPASVPQDAGQNEAANEQLHQNLLAVGATVYPTVSGEGEWREPGFAAVGVGREALVRFGEQLGQNAIVWVDAQGRATLIATRSGFCGHPPGEAIV